MKSRDFIAEMDAAIDAALPDSDYTAPLVAAELIGKLRANDPDLLAGWLDLQAAVFVTDRIARRSNSRRQSARCSGARSAFADAAREFMGGKAAALSPFATEYVIDNSNTRRKVRDMTAGDCRYVADRYEESARVSKLEAAFQRAVAKKLGNRTVGEVFSESQYLAMHGSLTGC